ncbi:MAG: glycosyltransferase family 9 protein [Candidatus Edwardsbacteria bacterium]|nr:glycosyltransferase family 9 protein [Candidatus Edwardsbacteria bacterium]
MRTPKTEKLFKRFLLWLFERIIPDELFKPEDIDKTAIWRILVIRQHDQLGDLLLSTPAFAALRKNFPNARITVIARHYTFAVLLNNPNIDQVLVFPEKVRLAAPARLWRLWRGLCQGYDLAIVLNTVSHSLSSDILAWLSGARLRLGSEELPFPGRRKNLFYNILAPAPETQLHETRRNLRILESFGLTCEDADEQVFLTGEEKEAGKQELWKNQLVPGKTIGIHLGAYNLCNRWPHEKYAALADWLTRELDFKVLAFWGPKEEKLGERFLGAVTSDVTTIHGLSLRQLAAVILRLRLMICNDTGIMHLSAAVGTPTFAVFGRSEPELWRPLNRRFYGVRGPDKTCASAELEAVKTAVKKMLNTCV